MAELLIKASPHHDWYMIWSTSVDGPLYIFPSRTEARDFLVEQHNQLTNGTYVPGSVMHPDSRMERADRYGTSSVIHMYSWDTEYLILGDCAPTRIPGYFWVLPRASLLEYCQLLHAGNDEAALKLFQKIEWN